MDKNIVNDGYNGVINVLRREIGAVLFEKQMAGKWSEG